MAKLSHVDAAGKAKMVDVSAKQPSIRKAIAQGRVRVSAALAEQIQANTLAKGDLLAVARIAGIQAAKRTDALIPMCHSLPLEHVEVDAWLEAPYVRLQASATVTSKTGVEMEALVAVSVAALTVVDMGKAVDPAMIIEDIRLIEKRGGRHGVVRPHQKGRA
jgi:cyclic pyranopterin phosphate synthase